MIIFEKYYSHCHRSEIFSWPDQGPHLPHSINCNLQSQ